MQAPRFRPQRSLRGGLAAGALGLAAAFALPSCGAIAAASVGVAVSQEFMDNSVAYYVPADVETSWAHAKRVVDGMSLDPITTDEERHRIEAVVEGARVFVHIEAFDVQETKVQVMAKRFATYENEMASDIAFRIRHSVAPPGKQ